MTFQSFYSTERDFSLYLLEREKEVSSLEIRLLSLEYNENDNLKVTYDAIYEERPSYHYQIEKIRATRKYIEEVKEPDIDRRMIEFHGISESVLDLIDVCSRLMRIFRLGSMSWGGIDPVQYAGFIRIMTDNLKEYLDLREEYYTILPKKDIFYEERVDYNMEDIPKNIKDRHREIGIFRAKILNDNRQKTYEYIKQLRIARAIITSAMAIATEFSSQFREFKKKLDDVISDITELRSTVDDMRRTLNRVAPFLASLSSPSSDGTVAARAATLVSFLAGIVAGLDKILVYINYFSGVNTELEELLKDARSHDMCVVETATII
jgi:tetrahydromethanopterin S-methyltransferase subunit B